MDQSNRQYEPVEYGAAVNAYGAGVWYLLLALITFGGLAAAIVAWLEQMPIGRMAAGLVAAAAGALTMIVTWYRILEADRRCYRPVPQPQQPVAPPAPAVAEETAIDWIDPPPGTDYSNLMVMSEPGLIYRLPYRLPHYVLSAIAYAVAADNWRFRRDTVRAAVKATRYKPFVDEIANGWSTRVLAEFTKVGIVDGAGNVTPAGRASFADYMTGKPPYPTNQEPAIDAGRLSGGAPPAVNGRAR